MAKRKWNPSLHPRDARGRFTRSSTRVMKGSDTKRAQSALTGFTAPSLTSQQDVSGWMERHSRGRRPAPDSALGQYLAGGWKETNPAIRAQKTPPPGVEEIDAEFGELPEDVVLRRQVPLRMFAHIPIKDLEGMKVRDAAYASTSLDTPDAGPSAPDAVTMHIAAAAGTPAYVNAPDGEILLARDTEIAITRAEPNGRGGWDLYGVVIPKTTVKRDRATGRDQDDDETTPPVADGPDTTGNGDAEQAPGTADEPAVNVDAPSIPGNPPTTDTSDLGNDNTSDRPTGDPTPTVGAPASVAPSSAPAGEQAGPWIAPATGALADLSPVDRERVRIAVENNAARIFRAPMIGGSTGNVARYVAEGRDLRDVSDRYGFRPTVNAVSEILANSPELMHRTDDEVAAATAARAADAMARFEAADAALTRGDYIAARAELSAGEATDPDFSLNLGGPPLDWADIHRIVDEIEQENNGSPADGTSVSAGEVTPRQIQDAAAKLGDAETDRIVGRGGLSGATDEQIAELMAAAAALPDDPDDGPGAGSNGGEPLPTGPNSTGPAQQSDIFGGATDFVPASRSTIGLADRPNVGRERAIAQVQQLGMFDVSDQRQMDGQMAMLDALMGMPSGDVATPPPPPVSRTPEPAAPSALATPAAPEAPASRVPDDLTGWNDEQLAELFRDVSGVNDPTQVDEAGAERVFAEWARRDAAMAELVASVPDDLTPLPDRELDDLFARVTSDPGIMHEGAVQRLLDEMDRRDAADRDAAENAPKRELLARPVSELSDDEMATAIGYAADLGDEEALERVNAEWQRRDDEQEVRAELERMNREVREAAEREAAQEAAREAERRAAAEHAQAAQERLVDAMAAAHEAAIVPAFNAEAASDAARVLGEDGLRAALGDAVVDQWINDIEAGQSVDRRVTLNAGVRQLPARDRVRAVLAAAGQGNAKEFEGWSAADLLNAVTDGVISPNPQRKALSQRAAQERGRRKMQELRAENVRQFQQWQARAMTIEPGRLSDAELELAPGMVTAMAAADGADPDILTARLDALRVETLRRQAEADEIAQAKAAGPAAPARYRNPVREYGYLRQMAETGSTSRATATRDRLRRAQAAVYGLPEDADGKTIRAAERNDPRPVADQAAAVTAWFRHLSQYEGVESIYDRGAPDDPDVPDTPDPLPPANVSKPDEVWGQINRFAQQEFVDGRYDTGHRLVRAVARTYRIPVENIEVSEDGIRRIQAEISPAIRHDQRTEKQRAADFLAQYRALAAEDGIDPADTLRYGPPDKGTRRTGRVPTRQSTPEQEQRIDALVARGWDWLDAYAEVHGVDRDALSAERARSVGGGVMSEKQLREAYAEHVERQFLAAETATAGHLLKPGSVGKIKDVRKLFSGAWRTAQAHASEELLRWWADNQRLTYADFKAQLVGGDAARASRERLVTAGKGNEFA